MNLDVGTMITEAMREQRRRDYSEIMHACTSNQCYWLWRWWEHGFSISGRPRFDLTVPGREFGIGPRIYVYLANYELARVEDERPRGWMR